MYFKRERICSKSIQKVLVYILTDSVYQGNDISPHMHMKHT